jgi:hypothetical protein
MINEICQYTSQKNVKNATFLHNPNSFKPYLFYRERQKIFKGKIEKNKDLQKTLTNK